MLTKQPTLYRAPRTPGYLGGNNWRATGLRLLSLVMVNFAATQFVASRFDYLVGSPAVSLLAAGQSSQACVSPSFAGRVPRAPARRGKIVPRLCAFSKNNSAY